MSKLDSLHNEFVCGLFPKREAAEFISAGVRHLHSSTLGRNDQLAKITERSVKSKSTPQYPWESLETAHKKLLLVSNSRQQIILDIVKELGLDKKRDFAERTSAVLEELISNSIYHAYTNSQGEDKYRRRSAVTLNENEAVEINYSLQPTGVYLSVKDHGGIFSFKALSDTLTRCYGPEKDQIAAKEGGAGLGLYMIYETATHLKIERDPKKYTRTSCWLADKKSFDPDYFSINYFERGAK